MLEGILLELGGSALSKLIGKKFGADMGELAKQGLEALAASFGVEPKEEAVQKRIEQVRAEPDGEQKARGAVAYAEAQIADKVLAQAELWRAANEQLKLANENLPDKEERQTLAGAWLWIWQYLLMVFWAWALVFVHLANAAVRLMGGTPLPSIDLTILMTLTGAYLALHMGGHTVLELMRGGVFERNGKP